MDTKYSQILFSPIFEHYLFNITYTVVLYTCIMYILDPNPKYINLFIDNLLFDK